jgi:hypothetical protein
LKQGIESSGIFYHLSTSWAILGRTGVDLLAGSGLFCQPVFRLNSTGFLTQAAGLCNQKQGLGVSTFELERVEFDSYELGAGTNLDHSLGERVNIRA